MALVGKRKKLNETAKDLAQGASRNPDTSQSSAAGNPWLIRGLGAALFLAGWAYFTLGDFGTARFFVDTLVFVALGAFAFIAAEHLQRETLALEKKLRLGLIMRNMELEGMATRDELTRLFTRQHFFSRLERELETAKGSERAVSVLVIDLSGMREINDTYGHRIGDGVLAAFGLFLLEQARASDVPARIGGDEFAIILPDTAESAATAAVNRLQQALDKAGEFEEGRVSIKLAATVAASGYPWGADSVDGIIREASRAARAQAAPVATPGSSAPTNGSAENGAETSGHTDSFTR